MVQVPGKIEERQFPLFVLEGKQQIHSKFTTATYWLNRDVELLLEAHDLSSVGKRQTLANLYKLIAAARTATTSG